MSGQRPAYLGPKRYEPGTEVLSDNGRSSNRIGQIVKPLEDVLRVLKRLGRNIVIFFKTNAVPRPALAGIELIIHKRSH